MNRRREADGTSQVSRLPISWSSRRAILLVVSRSPAPRRSRARRRAVSSSPFTVQTGSDNDETLRVEFSLHPIRRGSPSRPTTRRPTNWSRLHCSIACSRLAEHFSRAIGDKAFDLLVAQLVSPTFPEPWSCRGAFHPFTAPRLDRAILGYARVRLSTSRQFTTARLLDLSACYWSRSRSRRAGVCSRKVPAQAASIIQAHRCLLVQGVRPPAFMIGTRAWALPSAVTARFHGCTHLSTSALCFSTFCGSFSSIELRLSPRPHDLQGARLSNAFLVTDVWSAAAPHFPCAARVLRYHPCRPDGVTSHFAHLGRRELFMKRTS